MDISGSLTQLDVGGGMVVLGQAKGDERAGCLEMHF
jgi:hypothetical protein